LRDFVYGSTEDTAYDNWVSHITEGIQIEDYNIYAPWNRQTWGFGDFILPDEGELQKWSIVVHNFLNGDFTNAESAIAEHGYPYEIVEFEDTDTDRTYYILREKLNDIYFDDNGYPDHPEMHQKGGFDYAWGLYIVDPLSDMPVIVNVAHSGDDFISIPIATIAFQEWNARYLMFNAVGREFIWKKEKEEEKYENGKSLSDPSRNLNHPFNTVYEAACNQIRSKYGRRELSIQVHSYDHTHPGNTSIHISAMDRWGDDYYTGLPAHDMSGNFNDMINKTPYVVLEANTIGSHKEVLVTDYYSVLAGKDRNAYYKYGDELLEIDNDVFLASAIANKQMHYSNNGWNIYDVFSPFFHIELRELPIVYEQTEGNFKWFYGYDDDTDSWDTGNYYSNAITFYTPWIDAMTKIIPEALELDNGTPPTDPQNFWIEYDTEHAVMLKWDRSYDYDFDTYEIFYGTIPPDLEKNPQYSRNNEPILALQDCTELEVPVPRYRQQYFVLRAKDKHNNYSKELQLFRHQPVTYDEASIAVNYDYIELYWKTGAQYDVDGFIVKRAIGDSEEYTTIAGWGVYPELKGVPGPSWIYRFKDYNVELGVQYKYKISGVEMLGWEVEYDQVLSATFESTFHVGIRDEAGNPIDYFGFGTDVDATDLFDEGFDYIKNFDKNPGICSLHPTWGNKRFLQRDVRAQFDPNKGVKAWTVQVSTNAFNQIFELYLDDDPEDIEGDLHLYDPDTEEIVDLKQNAVKHIQTTNNKIYWLLWGNLKPEVSFVNGKDRLYKGRDICTVEWNMDGVDKVLSSIDLYFTDGENRISLGSDLDPESGTFDWYIPDSSNIIKGRFLLYAKTILDEVIESYSDYHIGIAPYKITLDNEVGWHLKANPFNPEAWDHAKIRKYFGVYASLFSYKDGDYTEVNEFLCEEGYLVYMSREFKVTLEDPFMEYDDYLTLNLSEGWNLIGNPYAIPLNVKDLSFASYGRDTRSYKDAVESNLIGRGIFGIKNNQLQIIETVEACEAFWIYANQSDLSIIIDPFADNEEAEEIESEWKVSVVMRDDGILKDEIVLGSVEAGDDTYNYQYDLLKPPARPLTLFELYIEGERENLKLHRKLKKDTLAENGETDITYPFVSEHYLGDAPLYFSIKGSNLPENYKVVLITDELHVVLSEEEEFEYTPSAAKMKGSIVITNKSVASVEEELPLVTELKGNFPNPFYTQSGVSRNIGTVIPFTIGKPTKTRIDVFNIKGQRVATLLDKDLNKGKYQINWDGRAEGSNKNATSGVYFYRLTTDDGYRQIKKMILLR